MRKSKLTLRAVTTTSSAVMEPLVSTARNESHGAHKETWRQARRRMKTDEQAPDEGTGGWAWRQRLKEQNGRCPPQVQEKQEDRDRKQVVDDQTRFYNVFQKEGKTTAI